MKLWIAGGHGMLGKVVHELCLSRNIDVVATARSDVDLTDSFALLDFAKNIQPTHIINCGAYTDVDGAERHAKEAFAINSQGVSNLALVAKLIHARLVHISTDYVFNGQAKQPYRESDPCDPISMYGMSKREGEMRLMQILPHACIVRTSWLFGAQGKNFVCSVLNWLVQKNKLQVVSDQRGCPTYVKDLAAAILELLNAEGLIHFCNAQSVSRYELTLQIKEMLIELKKDVACHEIEPVTSLHFPTPAQRPSYSVLSTEKYTQITGKQPRPWKEAMKEYLLHDIAT